MFLNSASSYRSPIQSILSMYSLLVNCAKSLHLVAYASCPNPIRFNFHDSWMPLFLYAYYFMHRKFSLLARTVMVNTHLLGMNRIQILSCCLYLPKLVQLLNAHKDNYYAFSVAIHVGLVLCLKRAHSNIPKTGKCSIIQGLDVYSKYFPR